MQNKILFLTKLMFYIKDQKFYDINMRQKLINRKVTVSNHSFTITKTIYIKNDNYKPDLLFHLINYHLFKT